MAKDPKAKYSAKQKRMAEHIEEGYEKRGTPKDEAEARAWATVNKTYGGGTKGGSGSTKKVNKAPAKTGGKLGGKASASRPKAAKKAAAKKAAATRKKNTAKKSTAKK